MANHWDLPIGHEIAALHGLDHAQTLAIVMPSLLKVMRANRGDKLLPFGERRDVTLAPAREILTLAA